MVRVSAGWARHGKRPRSYEDYAVLECDGPFSAPHYAAIIDRYALGNPPSERTGAEALPWVTLSEVQDDRCSYLAVAEYRWTDEVDGAGRPIAETRYACFPYPALRDAPVTYRELHAALDRVGDGEVELAGYDHEELARDLGRPGWLERAALAAAMLLDGQVTVTGADGMDLHTRLRFLDAVAALLPYGWRTRFTAATWIRGGGSPYISLVFASTARGGGFALDWNAPAAAPPPGTVAHTYWTELTKVLRHGGTGLAEVVDFLFRQGDLPAGEELQSAVRAIEWLEWPVRVVERTRAGTATVDELAELFKSRRWKELPDHGDRAFLLERLITYGGPEYAGAVEQGWPAADGAAGVREALRASARALLHDRPEDGADGWLAMAERLGFADDLLAELMPDEQASDALVKAVAGTVVRWTDPTGRSRPKTLDALGKRPPTVCASLVAQNTAAPGRVTAWLEALAGHAPEELLKAFRALCTPSAEPLTAHDIQTTAQHGVACVPALLQFATDQGRLEHVLPALLAWLEQLPAEQRGQWTAWLAGLEPESGAGRAVLDILLLYFGDPPRRLVPAGDPLWPAYLAAFRRHAPRSWRAPALEHVESGLRRHLSGGSWAADTGHARATLVMVRTVCEQVRHDWSEVVRQVVRGRATDPGLVDLPEYQGWLDVVAGPYRAALADQDMIVLTALPAAPTEERLGRLVAEALGRGVPGAQVLAWLQHSPAQVNGVTLAGALGEVRRELIRRGLTSPNADRQVLAFAAAIARSGGDRYLAHDFRDAVTAMAGSDLMFQLDLIQTASESGHEEPELPVRARSVLEDAVERIRDLLGKRRGRFLGGR
ncbi:hypothetical protein ACFVH6_41440 [Spirillospora sp. NPDC127200]